MDPATQNVYATLSSYLQDLGLGQLFTVDGNGNPSGWLWNQLQSGVDTAEELRLRLETTDVFRERFGVIVEQQRRAANGEPVQVMTPAQVIEYENRARQMMSMAGMPTWFYDEPGDFAKLMLADMSLQEVQARVSDAYDYVQAAPDEVKQAMEDYYGVGRGEAALAAWALDPDRVLRDVNKATRTAYAAGMANRFDIEIDRQTAGRIADLPTTEEGIVTGLRQVARLGDVFNEGITERGDITSSDGVASVFEGDAAASRDIERRVAERDSINRSSTGGAAVTAEGVIGSGSL